MTQSDSNWRIQELELQYQRDIEQTKMFHQEEYQRFEFDYQIRVGDINRNWDDELRFADEFYNNEISNAQNEGNNQEAEFLMEEKQQIKKVLNLQEVWSWTMHIMNISLEFLINRIMKLRI